MSPGKMTRLGLAARSAIFFVISVMGMMSFAPSVFAGTISSSYKYAWSNVGGWVNFTPTNSVVTVTNSALTGYVWSENDGWINLSPTRGGVTNNGGTLGGFAWDQTAGWVDFTGVTIDSAGKFHGQATGANGYAINFSCANCDVRTDWRAGSAPVTPAVASPGAISPVFAPHFLPSVAAQPPSGEQPPTMMPAPSKTEIAPRAALPGGAVYTPVLETGTSAPAYGHAMIPAHTAAGTAVGTSSPVSRPVTHIFRAIAVSLGAALSTIKMFFVSLWKFFF